jgi:NAD(P)-dependent dehydrogenase (short-subunit alcohol dehydrogenase family)
MSRVTDKVALVTGGAHGIGRATCELLAREGAMVALCDLDDENGQQAVKEITDSGAVARYWHLDVSDEEQVERVFAEVEQAFGMVDVLVNNAGISGANKPTHELTTAEWQKVMRVNVDGVFYCTRRAVPPMRDKGRGSIINLSSIYGIIGAPDIPPYHASKGALRSMTKTDAVLYAKDGIRVNSVHPGFIWTPLVEEMANNSPQSVEEFRHQLDQRHPVGHVGEPMDIAYGICYLAADESRFVTGSELVIDGGYTAR